MNNSPARNHYVHLAGTDRLDVALAVSVDKFAGDEVAQCGESNVGMGTGVNPLAWAESDWTKAVEKNERTHHPAHRRGKCSPDFEATQVTRVWKNNLFNFRIREVSHVFHPVSFSVSKS